MARALARDSPRPWRRVALVTLFLAQGIAFAVGTPVAAASATVTAPASADRAHAAEDLGPDAIGPTPESALERFGLEVLDALSVPDAATVSATLHANPDWDDVLDEHPPAPSRVADWWADLDAEAVRDALVDGAPAVIGNLAGVPVVDRVRANAVVAADRFDTISTTAPWVLVRCADGTGSDAVASRAADLGAEADFLADVVEGTAQLAGYRPAAGELVQLIGTPSESTTTTVTFTPGTYSTMHSVFDGATPQFGHAIASRDPDLVVFVWLDGRFPGGSGADDLTGAVTGLVEANDAELTLEAGRELAAFATGLDADPLLDDTRRIAVGHSWGLAATTASELAGAHYDQVHSLAGAYTAPGWTPSRSTEYYHWSYVDFVSMLRLIGAVGGESSPADDPAFSSTVYASRTDLSTGGQAGLADDGHTHVDDPLLADTGVALDGVGNHELITSDRPANRAALAAIVATMTGA